MDIYVPIFYDRYIYVTIFYDGYICYNFLWWIYMLQFFTKDLFVPKFYDGYIDRYELRWGTIHGRMWWRFLVENSTLLGLLIGFILIYCSTSPLANQRSIQVFFFFLTLCSPGTLLLLLHRPWEQAAVVEGQKRKHNTMVGLTSMLVELWIWQYLWGMK